MLKKLPNDLHKYLSVSQTFNVRHLKRFAIRRLLILTFYLIFILGALAFRLYSISTGAAAERARFQALTMPPARFWMFDTNIAMLQDTVLHIDSLSIHDLRDRLSNLSDFLTVAQAEMVAQQRDWLELQSLLATNAEKYQSLQSDILRLNTVKEEQLKLAAEIVNRENKKTLDLSFYWGLIISFPIGVTASLIASYLWERSMKKKRRKPIAPVP